MAIEKVFSINAAPHVIYRALENDIAGASAHSGSIFEVLRRDPGKSLELRVTMGGVPCLLTYRLDAKPDHTEVVATLQPYGWKYTFFRFITFGMHDQGFEISLVEGLANLKAAVEEGTADLKPD